MNVVQTRPIIRKAFEVQDFSSPKRYRTSNRNKVHLQHFNLYYIQVQPKSHFVAIHRLFFMGKVTYVKSQHNGFPSNSLEIYPQPTKKLFFHDSKLFLHGKGTVLRFASKGSLPNLLFTLLQCIENMVESLHNVLPIIGCTVEPPV